MWRTSYLAVSAALGISLEEAEACLSEGHSSESLALARALRAPSKRDRALALARPLADVLRAVEAARLA